MNHYRKRIINNKIVTFVWSCTLKVFLTFTNLVIFLYTNDRTFDIFEWQFYADGMPFRVLVNYSKPCFSFPVTVLSAPLTPVCGRWLHTKQAKHYINLFNERRKFSDSFRCNVNFAVTNTVCVFSTTGFLIQVHEYSVWCQKHRYWLIAAHALKLFTSWCIWRQYSEQWNYK